jgi:aspartyl-tRNA(Asn)/glutamyl-tRNA(Gln) amidotransferase subunit B
MNSISNVKRAIDFEIERQKELLTSGQSIVQETRGFNGLNGSTFSMRKKESNNDYRYFPEPDLPPVLMTQSEVERIRREMPELPGALYKRFTHDYGLSEYDASVLIDDKHSAFYFEAVCRQQNNYKAVANWVTVPVRGYLNEQALGMEDFPLAAESLAELIALVDEGVISHSIASQKLFPALLENPKASARGLVESLNLATNTDSSEIEGIVQSVLAQFPDKVQAYQSGKTGLMGLFVGEVMKRSGGKADPKITNQLLQKHLNSPS